MDDAVDVNALILKKNDLKVCIYTLLKIFLSNESATKCPGQLILGKTLSILSHVLTVPFFTTKWCIHIPFS